MDKNPEHEIVTPNERMDLRVTLHTSMTPDSFSAHWHRSLEINCMLRWPETDLYIGARHYRMHSPRVWIVNPQEPHTIHALRTDPKRRAVSIICPYPYLRRLYPQIDEGLFVLNDWDALSERQRTAHDEELLPRCERLAQLLETDETPLLYLDLNITTLEVLRVLLADFFVPNGTDARRDLDVENIERIQQIVDYVASHYTEDVRVEDLCEVLHLSRGYMARFIKEHLGYTTGEYVGLVRAEHARKDLLSGRGNKSEVAVWNGYSGLRTMNRHLERYFGTDARGILQAAGK